MKSAHTCLARELRQCAGPKTVTVHCSCQHQASTRSLNCNARAHEGGHLSLPVHRHQRSQWCSSIPSITCTLGLPASSAESKTESGLWSAAGGRLRGSQPAFVDLSSTGTSHPMRRAVVPGRTISMQGQRRFHSARVLRQGTNAQPHPCVDSSHFLQSKALHSLKCLRP